MTLWRSIAAASVTVAIVAAPAAAAAHSLDSLEQQIFEREQYFQIKDLPAPGFMLQDADGKVVRLSDFAGKVVILHFIYASCPDICPLHAEKLAEVQEMIAITPMRDQVEFVTVTTDPKRDTPEVMHEYGPLHGLDAANWMFLTSDANEPEDQTRRLAEQYGLKFTETGDGLQMHGTVTMVIDREGRWRASFHGLEFNPTNLVVYVNALVNDVHEMQHEEALPQLSLWQRILSWF
jgi:protein SCO1/2